MKMGMIKDIKSIVFSPIAIFSTSLLLLCWENSLAVEVRLSNGKIFSGEVVSENNEYITIDVGGSKIPISKEIIVEINGKQNKREINKVLSNIGNNQAKPSQYNYSSQIEYEWLSTKRINTMQEYYSFLSKNCQSLYADSARINIARILLTDNAKSSGIVIYSNGEKKRIEDDNSIKTSGQVDINDPCSGDILHYEYIDSIFPEVGKKRIITRKARYTSQADNDRNGLPSDYGFDKDKAIIIGFFETKAGPIAEEIYLSLLRDRFNRPFSYRRLGNVGTGQTGGVIDKYVLTTADNTELIVYTDSYHPAVLPYAVPALLGMHL